MQNLKLCYLHIQSPLPYLPIPNPVYDSVITECELMSSYCGNNVYFPITESQGGSAIVRGQTTHTLLIWWIALYN